MKIELLKNIIRESVKEAVREELKELLVELIHPTSPVIETKTTANVSEPESTSSNPLSEMINLTRKSMNSNDFKNILETGYRPDFSEISLNTNNIANTQPSFSGVQTGIDITKLDFVKNAASIYNKSIEKDKARIG